MTDDWIERARQRAIVADMARDIRREWSLPPTMTPQEADAESARRLERAIVARPSIVVQPEAA